MLKQLLIGLSLLVVLPLAAYAQNIDGVWRDARGVPYYIRQVGNEIWWFGENQPVAPAFSNVAHGKIDARRLILSWADVPKGINQSAGILVFQVTSATRLDILQDTGSWCLAPF